MMYETNPTQDSNFDWQRVIQNYNANLADNLGNLVVRVSKLIEKYLDGLIDPDVLSAIVEEDSSESQAEGSEVVSAEKSLLEQISLRGFYQELENYNPQAALQELFRQGDWVNTYLEKTQPWKLAKNLEENRPQIEQILSESAKFLLEVGKALSIIMPAKGEAIYKTFNRDRIGKSEVIFPKIEGSE
jgi:methionyl-tRNA synthetase